MTEAPPILAAPPLDPQQAAANPTRTLIDETCRRFAATCGWPLRFLPRGRDEEGVPECERLWRRELRVNDRVIGALVLDLPENEALDAEFLHMTKAGELTAGLLEETLVARRAAEVSHGEVEALARMGSSVPSLPDLPSALSQLLRAATQLTGFRAAAFFLLDAAGDGLTLRLRYEAAPARIPAERRRLSDGPPDLTALIGGAADTGGAVVLRRGEQPGAVAWLPPNMATAVCLPVQSGSSPIGTLWAFDRRDRAPEPRELHVLGSIASQLASVLERAVLVRESASEKKLRRHLRAAGESQPGQVLTAPAEDCGFESAGMCKSSLEVGGDLIELIPLAPGRTLVAIGDASGDGVPAAMVMANVRGAVRLAAAAAADSGGNLGPLDRLTADINNALCGITPAHQFMSLLIGVYDALTRTFVYTNAGHPTPLHLRGGVCSELESHGMLLGVMEVAEYEVGALPLAADDLLVFYTDGISEAMCRNHRMFRSDGITGAVRSVIDRPPAEIVETIWSRLMTHRRGSEESDDRSLLVLRIR